MRRHCAGTPLAARQAVALPRLWLVRRASSVATRQLRVPVPGGELDVLFTASKRAVNEWVRSEVLHPLEQQQVQSALATSPGSWLSDSASPVSVVPSVLPEATWSPDDCSPQSPPAAAEPAPKPHPGWDVVRSTLPETALLLGLDCEYHSGTSQAAVSVLQLASRSRVLIAQLDHLIQDDDADPLRYATHDRSASFSWSSSSSPPVRDASAVTGGSFLTSCTSSGQLPPDSIAQMVTPSVRPRLRLVGASIHDDARRLGRWYPALQHVLPTVDLQTLVHAIGGPLQMGLEAMAIRWCDAPRWKRRSIACSNWANPSALTEAHLVYAALDAWWGLQVAQFLQRTAITAPETHFFPPRQAKRPAPADTLAVPAATPSAPAEDAPDEEGEEEEADRGDARQEPPVEAAPTSTSASRTLSATRPSSSSSSSSMPVAVDFESALAAYIEASGAEDAASSPQPEQQR